jgi:hypothetical protein
LGGEQQHDQPQRAQQHGAPQRAHAHQRQSGDGTRRQPRDYHAQQRLAIEAGQL